MVHEFRRRVLGADRQRDGVADLLLELGREVCPQDNLAGAAGVDVTPVRKRELHRGIAVLAGIRAGDEVRHAETDPVGRAGFRTEADLGKGSGHAVNAFQLDHLVERQQPTTAEAAQRAARVVGNLDVRSEVLGAASEQRVEFLGHRAHGHQGKHADHDPADRQDVAQLAPRQVSNDFHVFLLCGRLNHRHLAR